MGLIGFVLLVVASTALSLELPRALWPRQHMSKLGHADTAGRWKLPLAVGLGALFLACSMVVLNGGAFGNGPIPSLGFIASFVGAASLFCLPLLYLMERGEDLYHDDGAIHAPDPVGTRMAFGFALGVAFIAAGILLIWAGGA